LGADIVKIHWDCNKEDLAWAVKSAGKVKVVIAGGKKEDESKLLLDIRGALDVGVSGLAIGRNIWQSKKPLELTRKIKNLIGLK
jgi:class I fructose-bisphosphate aldolase